MIFWKSCSRLSKNITFERPGSILDVPGTDQNRKKWALHPHKNAILKNPEKSRLFNKSRKRGTLHFDHMYGAFFMFLKNAKVEKTENHEKTSGPKTWKIEVWVSFWMAKSHPKWRLFRNMKNNIKIESGKNKKTWKCRHPTKQKNYGKKIMREVASNCE